MALYVVLVSTILAFSLTTAEQYVSSPGSSINLSLHSMKNASGHSITKVDTMKENPRLLSENVHQETNKETEQIVSEYPSLHDTSMSGAVQPTAASTSPSTPTATTLSTSTSAANTSSTTITTTTTTTPKSCPQSGYQLYPEFNCYKIFSGEMKNWSEAREQCTSDGGDLMVMESEQERTDVYIPLIDSVEFYAPPWVGVYIPQGGTNWTTVKGEPALSTWWQPGEPDGNAAWNCAFANGNGLLVNYNCEVGWFFICEISL